MACSETKDMSTFVSALKANKNDRSKLAAILNCPKASELIKGIDGNALKVDNVLPVALKEALQNKYNELQYGYLQLDNDRSFLKCVNMIKAMELEKICAKDSCSPKEIESWGTKLTTDENYGPCHHFFMKDRINEMVSKINESFKGETKARSEIITDIKSIIATAPITAAKAGILMNKRSEASVYDSRKNLLEILKIEVPKGEKEELSADLDQVASE